MEQRMVDLHGLEGIIGLLRCPVTGEALSLNECELINASGSRRYRVSSSGVPHFESTAASKDARIQQQHYDRVAAAYLENLAYPHTQEYSNYLDRAMREAMSEARLDRVAEICCGSGEGFRVLERPVGLGIGVDISGAMLERARKDLSDSSYQFLQGDATNLPLRDGIVDTVIMNGGIHHVNNRQRLFDEVFRILRPGGSFYFREPCDDFTLWRLIRRFIYRVSPGLDHETERPLRVEETVPLLERAGFHVRGWKTYGFLGFCFFMNSDILIFNRLFRFIPGIRALTRFATRVDDWTVRLPGLSGAGLQVVGWAQKDR